MLKKAKNLIKSQDLVGHPVSLSFNGKGNLHQTFLGGIISSFVRLYILYVLISKTQIMLTHGNDNVSKITQLLTDDDLGLEMNLKDSKVNMLLLISNRWAQFMRIEDYEPYITVEFYE